MAEITNADIARLKALIDRFEGDVDKSTVAFNGDENATYTADGGATVPSYQKWLADRNLLVRAETITATGNISITPSNETYMFIDTNGATRTVTLPAGGVAYNAYLISNIGAESIDVLEPDGITVLWAALVSPFSVAVVFDGTVWRVV